MEYNRYASSALAEYEIFAGALTTDFLLARGVNRGPMGSAEFRTAGMATVSRFMTRMVALTTSYASTVSDGSLSDITATRYMNALRTVATKNVHDLALDLMRSDGRMADLLNRPAGSIGDLLQRHLATPNLVALDKGGRRWQARIMVKTLARGFAYQAFIDHQAAGIEKQGYDLAEVVYPDPAHAGHGEIVSISGDDEDFPSLGGTRNHFFHPNSSAQLRAYVPT